jgi:quercetin dioxygenase-like cupin family protein
MGLFCRKTNPATPGLTRDSGLAELQISPTQTVPWHSHSNVQDTFYVIEGELRLFMKDPEEECVSGQARRIRCGQDGRTS